MDLKLDFERLFNDHVNILKGLVNDNPSPDAKRQLLQKLDYNQDEMELQIKYLFGSKVIADRFGLNWEKYKKNVLQYIEIMKSQGVTVSPDFGEGHDYLELKSQIRYLRKNLGEITGFFSYYFEKNRREEFRDILTRYMQALKDGIDNGKLNSDFRQEAIKLGKLINEFR